MSRILQLPLHSFAVLRLSEQGCFLLSPPVAFSYAQMSSLILFRLGRTEIATAMVALPFYQH